MVLKKAPNGYSISSDVELNGKLEVMKRMLGARNYAQIIKTMLLCPTIDGFLFDRFRDTCLLEGKEQYIKTHQVEPSGTYRMTYVKLPKSGKVVIENE